MRIPTVLLLLAVLAIPCLAQTPGKFSDIPSYLQTMEGRSWHGAPLGNSNTLFQQIMDQKEHNLPLNTLFLGTSFRHEGNFISSYIATAYTSQVAFSAGTNVTAVSFSTNSKANRHANYQVCMPKRTVNMPVATPPYFPWKEVSYYSFTKPFLYGGGALLFELKNYDTTGNQAIVRNVERTYPGYLDTLTGHTSGPYGWFGTECPAAQNTLTVNTSNLKVGGTWYSLLTSPSANNSTALSFLGFSNTKWLMLNLPLDLGPLGFTGCKLYTGINMSMVGTWDATNTQYKATWPFPNNPAIAGLVFYNQWAILSPSSPGGLGFSHALNCKIAPALAPGMPLLAKYGYYVGAADPDTDPTMGGTWNACDCLRIYHP